MSYDNGMDEEYQQRNHTRIHSHPSSHGHKYCSHQYIQYGMEPLACRYKMWPSKVLAWHSK